MKKKKIELGIPDEVEFIGGAGTLTEEDAKLISEYIRSQKEKRKNEEDLGVKSGNETGGEQPGATHA